VLRDPKLTLSSLVDAIKAKPAEVAAPTTENFDFAVVSVVSRPTCTIASTQKASGPPLGVFTGLSVGIAAAVLVWKHDQHRARIVNGCEWVGRLINRSGPGPSLSAAHEPTAAEDMLTHEAPHEEDMTAPEAAPARSSAWHRMASSVSARARVEPPAAEPPVDTENAESLTSRVQAVMYKLKTLLSAQSRATPSANHPRAVEQLVDGYWARHAEIKELKDSIMCDFTGETRELLLQAVDSSFLDSFA
jgi:hypothetical protein